MVHLKHHNGPSGFRKQRQELLDQINFDPENLLDPRVCNGENMIPNILRTLHANEDIIKNPYVMALIENHVKCLRDQEGRSIDYWCDPQPSSETIQSCYNIINNNGILSPQELDSKKFYFGIQIDSETDKITLQTFDKSDNYTHTRTFTPDGNGNVVSNETSTYETSTYSFLPSTSCNCTTTEKLYNPDGIAIKSDVKHYEHTDGNKVFTSHTITTRDSQYPFIAREESKYSDSSKTEYILLPQDRLYFLSDAIEPAPQSFITRLEIDSFYQTYKQDIDQLLTQEPNYYSFLGIDPTPKLKQSLQSGMIKLALQAGIIQDPNAQEKDVQ